MRALIPSTCLLLLTALGGCVGTSDPPHPIPEIPNQFTYNKVDYPYAVHFATASDAISPSEMTRLQGFLKSSSARPEDKVTVSGETSVLGKNRSSRVGDVLKRAGLDVAPGVDVNLAPNTVNIVLTEQVVDKPPRCDDWPLFAGDAPSNAPSLYLGCAMRNNLYQQVVDKRDLAVGRTPGPADAEPGMRAVQKYREGKNDKGGGSSQGESASGAAGAASSMGTSVGGGSNGQ